VPTTQATPHATNTLRIAEGATLQLKFGTYSFPINGCECTSQTGLIRSETGRPIRYRMAIHAKVTLITSGGQAGCTLIENQLRAALLIPYQTLSLLQDDGAPSSMTLNTNNSISGVVITDGPHFPEAMNAEFVNRRTAEFSGEAEFLIQNAANAVLSFHETVAITGNAGPVMSWRQAVNAGPVFQQVYPFSTVRATQTGRAVGHMSYPVPPALLFPEAFLHQERSRTVRESPRRIGPGGGLIEYPVSWSYDFEANVPLFALPNIPPL